MTDSSITLRKADAADADRVEALLKANGLPHSDVRLESGRFFVASADAAVVGIGGVETYGSNGLLRSVVVPESKRGRGYGTSLCDALEDRAQANGVETLYLLTTTAAAFFRRRGYEEVERERVPASIRQTTEFADLCPSSATCMRKEL
ncbi:arsenic resistance N-acetyltransferase ArsN2 [Halorussus limi]|uniref:Arsenic resistance N-acetyltransferase ArsN2 n=1 Tax=Halorussus limi TaxID=2938695 RepID=A0A8U0HQQ6_9EURY|nr:arsenic resistance N-acetyltransferase ArsN2 [Halorussus limi]UPV73083.1 arsenic resistance N-acetyltransferase ArsN2 [Halorussus limi]